MTTFSLIKDESSNILVRPSLVVANFDPSRPTTPHTILRCAKLIDPQDLHHYNFKVNSYITILKIKRIFSPSRLQRRRRDFELTALNSFQRPWVRFSGGDFINHPSQIDSMTIPSQSFNDGFCGSQATGTPSPSAFCSDSYAMREFDESFSGRNKRSATTTTGKLLRLLNDAYNRHRAMQTDHRTSRQRRPLPSTAVALMRLHAFNAR